MIEIRMRAVVGLFLLLLSSTITQSSTEMLESNNDGKDNDGPTITQEIEAVEGKGVSFPCDVIPPGHDKVYMVLWFHDDSGIPIYSFDVRGKPMSQARHWSSPEAFGTRAYFRTVSEPAQLVIESIKRQDEGFYRCRVDFKNAQTRSFHFNLTVVVPPEQPIILDKWGRHLNGSIGPHEVGDDIIMTCRTVGGHPRPIVKWLVNGSMVDDEYELSTDDVIENRLMWPSISRKDLNAVFTCCAENTRLSESRKTDVLLELILRPLTVHIRKIDGPLVADKRYEVTCISAGSRPPAIITWYKGKRQLRKAKGAANENETISELSFVPTTEDDGKSVTCRAENPNVTGLFLEAAWKIDVVYPPIVNLNLGSTLNANDIKEGDDVYFECKVRANPHWRRLTWLHNDVVLPHNMSNRIIHSNQSLVLQKVTKQSAGIYRCSVVNSEGETISNELRFRVQFAPTCRFDKITIVGASRGESVDVICQIESDPPAKTYKWKFNNSGETLELETERFAKTSNGSFSILKYTPISELDYGSLSCWAVNTVGHQVTPCIFQVVAAGKPFPVKNCTLTNQTSNSIEIYCLPGFDGGLPQHFLLEMYTANSLIPRYNLTSYVEPYFFLDNLETDITFRIAVFAVNSKGRSNGVVLEEVTFRDAEKRTATESNLVISPLLGILIGGTITIIIIIIIIVVRIRKSQNHPQINLDEKTSNIPGGHCNTMASTKPLLRSGSPREIDERDPDIIPAQYGGVPGEDENIGGGNSSDGGDGGGGGDNGCIVSLNTSHHPLCTEIDADLNYSNEIVHKEWMYPNTTSTTTASIKYENQMPFQYHQYNNPVAMVGTFPRDSRPKDLYLGNGQSATLARTSDLELNGLAIKERLMASRLPESCV